MRTAYITRSPRKTAPVDADTATIKELDAAAPLYNAFNVATNTKKSPHMTSAATRMSRALRASRGLPTYFASRLRKIRKRNSAAKIDSQLQPPAISLG